MSDKFYYEGNKCSHEWGESVYRDDARREYFACTKCRYLSPIYKEKDHFNFSASGDRCICKEGEEE